MTKQPPQYFGEPVPDLGPALMPAADEPLKGNFVILEKITEEHMPVLLEGLKLPAEIERYRMMGFPDITNVGELSDMILNGIVRAENAIVFAIRANKSSLGPPSEPPQEKPDVLGFLALATFDLPSRAIEAGAAHGPDLSRTFAATEAHYLLLSHLFNAAVPFRRVSWKTNSLNLRSRRCAERLGYKHEGTFRNHMITQYGTSRDTAWFSIVEEDWPSAKQALQMWMSPSNFDEKGVQKSSLGAIRNRVVGSHA